MSNQSLYRYLDSSQKIQLDPEGYLVKQDQWSGEVAQLLAEDEGLTLTEKHWEIIQLVREFYTRYEMAPAMRPLVKATKQALGDEKGNSIYLMTLFPGSPPKRIARIAGLPKPTNCL
ncbi:MAG: TusE/DsrC/DsvC family sulfur relay protein [Vreelandella alkaliphila]|uniref:Sulfurtransferase n=1 Tax=Halomonas campaniensis TaxID=213554 RepID=A0A3D0KKE5_9GAMM|nr:MULTISPECIES: TusE/DsrC/DsvC family sulfur relay protein [unclassified Halomonas]HBP42182.1 sulfurtransferase TusE [Halomonas sp.]HBS83669.1 sulfurtransferase TusE [Halomonas campaniensis]HCA03974.1 sulfurtransferase TusE [Halomonas campaniensis]